MLGRAEGARRTRDRIDVCPTDGALKKQREKKIHTLSLSLSLSLFPPLREKKTHVPTHSSQIGSAPWHGWSPGAG